MPSLEDLAKKLASFRVGISAAHDRMNWKVLQRLAKKRLEIEVPLLYRVKLTEEMIWLAAEAEEVAFRCADEELYGAARIALGLQREALGVETNSSYYTAKWWRDFRREDFWEARYNLLLEQYWILEFLPMEPREKMRRAKELRDILAEAWAVHKKHDYKKEREVYERYYNQLLKLRFV